MFFIFLNTQHKKTVAQEELCVSTHDQDTHANDEMFLKKFFFSYNLRINDGGNHEVVVFSHCFVWV